MVENREGANVRVMIIDDHEIVRRGISDIIDRADGLEVVAEAGSKAEAIRRADLMRPDVVLVDLQLPDGTGIEGYPRPVSVCPAGSADRANFLRRRRGPG